MPATQKKVVMKTKPKYEQAVRASVSMPPVLHKFATGKQRERGLSTFSDYIQELIRRDLEEANNRQEAA